MMLDRRLGIAAWVVLVAASQSGAAPANDTEHPAAAWTRAIPACDMADAVAAATPGATVRRDTGTFPDDALRVPAQGCHLAISGSFSAAPSEGDAASRLREGFAAHGWHEMLSYAADGKDGTAFAFRKGEVGCLVRGSWNGGADGEPPVERGDAYVVSVLCTSPPPPEQRGK